MLVGDPKQSIYRFRQADVTVWTEVQQDFRDRGFGRHIPLERNYRSVAPVLAFVDAVIGPVLDFPINGVAHADFEVPFASVAATRTDGPKDDAVELILHPSAGGGEKVSADESRRREAATIAARALELRQERGRWGGMALLLGSWSSAGLYEAALQAVGAPTYALQQEGFYRRQEVVDLLVALEAIRNPRNDIALFGFLRGPFVGVRDETLLELALAGRGPHWDRLPDYHGGETALVARGITLLQRFGALRDRIPTAELLERLLVDGGYLAHLALLGEDGRQPIANLRKLVRIARESAQGGVGDFVRQLRAARDNLDREGGARLYGEQDDVVTITSIHSAKGLQWEVVFWADLGRQPINPSSDPLLLTRDRMLIRREDDPESEELTTELTEQIRREGQAERKRLWYVAATRARDRLIVSGFELEKQPAGSTASALAPLLAPLIGADRKLFSYEGQGSSFTGQVHQAAALTAEPALVAGVVLEPEAVLARPLPRLRVPLGQLRHSATEFLSWHRCPERHYLRYVAGLREPSLKGAGGAREDAVRRGVIVHDVLERLREEAELELLLEDAIHRHDPEAPPGDTVAGASIRDQIRAEVTAVETHAAYRALADAPGARHELGFIALLGGGDRIEGKMDLAAPMEGGIVLLDVKTGRVADGDTALHAAHYAPQRDVYVTAAEAISGLRVSRFAFQFSRAGLQHSEPITEEVRLQARRSQGEILRSIGDGSRGLTDHPDECRFCGFRVTGWCPGVAG
jgi:ATP-dependent helicase/nuclease subunit A